jgi:hypothetical protein
MTPPAFASLPAPAVHVERIGYGAPRFIYAVTVVRETKTQWIDDAGTRWRKSDGAMVPQYVSPRYLMTTEAYEAARSSR